MCLCAFEAIYPVYPGDLLLIIKDSQENCRNNNFRISSRKNKIKYPISIIFAYE